MIRFKKSSVAAKIARGKVRRSRTIRFLSSALLVIVALAVARVGSAAEVPWTLDSISRELDRASKEFRSLSANVDRTKVTVVVNDRSTESGTMEVRRDDKMRIDLTTPDPRTILRDGDHLYIYNPKIRSVEEYDLGKHRALVEEFLLLGFGTSGDSLKKSYVITFQGEETLGSEKVVHLELTPRADDVRAQISKIELWIDEATWLPAQQQFYETGSGDYFIIRYTNVVRNVRLADSRFRAHWPDGVTRTKPGN
jgi:outer membrane lipoprotein-sorting protein